MQTTYAKLNRLKVFVSLFKNCTFAFPWQKSFEYSEMKIVLIRITNGLGN